MTTVLVVDDEPQILRGLGTNLRARGYDVVTAPDGEQALTIAARDRPDIAPTLPLPGPPVDAPARGLRYRRRRVMAMRAARRVIRVAAPLLGLVPGMVLQVLAPTRVRIEPGPPRAPGRSTQTAVTPSEKQRA